jgi:hypothetical protein
MAIEVRAVDTGSREAVRRFVDIAFRLYEGHSCWVPPLKRDAAAMLNRRAHPFYERSDAAFYIAARDGRDAGRIAVLDHRPFNEHHGARDATFYCFESEDDPEVLNALLARAGEWAHARKLTRFVGPKGFSAFDGYGLLVDGFQHRPMMTMTNYNPAWYGRMFEDAGFVKDVDFVSFHIHAPSFTMPNRVRRVAEHALRRGRLRVRPLKNRRQLIAAARHIGETYNQAFVQNWEYYPLSSREIDFLVHQLILFANPRLITLISDGDTLVGFLFAFPDVSAALQRARGRLTPWTLADILLESRRTTWLALNGAGVLPAYQGRGGNAVLYAEMQKTVLGTRYVDVDLPQVAETAVQMRRDLAALGAHPYKTHRVFARTI